MSEFKDYIAENTFSRIEDESESEDNSEETNEVD